MGKIALSTTPRLVISAPQGRSGKTAVSIGICATLRRRGFSVQPFKKGPDYIDPSWLTAASQRACYNLDPVMMPEKTVLGSFRRACEGADLAVIEGAMGLFDGIDETGKGSTAGLARLLKSPVILIVNAARMTTSAAAMVSGYQRFEPETRVAGIIFNNVSGTRHERKLVTAIEKHCGIPVLGCVPRDSRLSLAERHLGLVPYGEASENAIIERISVCIEKHTDLDGILEITRSASAIEVPCTNAPSTAKAVRARLGVISDNIFTFYYPDNIEALRGAGAELVFISSVHDRQLPDIDGLYIGGGFPEMFLPELEANISLRRSIAQTVEDGLPVYAECAGLMYLCRSIGWHGKQYEMVSVLPADVELTRQPQGHGYVRIDVAGGNGFLPEGSYWGHEFHHSRLLFSGDVRFAYSVKRGYGVDGVHDGIVYKNVLAAFTHLHALGVQQWAEAFVSLAEKKHTDNCKLSTVN